MPKVQFTVGAGRYAVSRFVGPFLEWTPADGIFVLPPAFFANLAEPAADRDIRYVGLLGNNSIHFRLGTESSSSAAESGDLSTTAEASPKLITLQAPGWGPYTFVGPGNAQATTKDTSEPYSWIDGNYTLAQLRAIITAYNALSSNAKAQTTVAVDDNTRSFEATLAIPAPAFDIRLEAASPKRIVAGLSIPAPAFDISVNIIPPPQRIEASLAIPAPAFDIRLDTEEPQRIAPIEATLAIPAPAFNIQLGLLHPISFRAGLVIPAPTFSATIRTQYIPRPLHAGFTIPALAFAAQLDLDTTPPELRDAETDWVIENLRIKADSTVVVTASAYREGLYTFPAERADAENVEDSFAPETDFSQTPPEPLRDLTAETVYVDVGGISVPECSVTFLPPTENYGGTEIWLALGAGAPGLQTLEDPNRPGQARFALPIDAGRYRVIAYSLNKNRTLRGVPLEILVNQSPVASAFASYLDESETRQIGKEVSVNAGELVTLDGSFSTDPDNDPLLFLWTQISGEPVILSNTQAESPTFTAPSSAFRSYVLEFQLTVTDGLLTSTDSVIVNVARFDPGAEAEDDDTGPPAPDPVGPVVTITLPTFDNLLARPGHRITFAATAVAVGDKTITSIQWFALSPSRTLVSTNASFIYLIPSDLSLTKDTNFTFAAVATDSEGVSTEARITITVTASAGNAPPPPRNPTLDIGRTATHGTFSWQSGGTPAADYYEYRVNRDGNISNWIRTTATRVTLEGGGYGNAGNLHWAQVRACRYIDRNTLSGAVGCSDPDLAGDRGAPFKPRIGGRILFLNEARNIQTVRAFPPGKLGSNKFLTVEPAWITSVTAGIQIEFDDLDEPANNRRWTYYIEVPRGFEMSRARFTWLSNNQLASPPPVFSTWDNNFVVRYRFIYFNAWGYSPWGDWLTS